MKLSSLKKAEISFLLPSLTDIALSMWIPKPKTGRGYGSSRCGQLGAGVISLSVINEFM